MDRTCKLLINGGTLPGSGENSASASMHDGHGHHEHRDWEAEKKNGEHMVFWKKPVMRQYASLSRTHCPTNIKKGIFIRAIFGALRKPLKSQVMNFSSTSYTSG
jgi:hypothetical protein